LDARTVLLYALSLLALYALGYFALVPLKWAFRLLLNSVAGGLLLLLLNWIGGSWGLSIAVNPWTALTVGLLGMPGLALLLILSAIL